jgi:nucleotide-binding universal stress UspA family protein
VTGDEETDRRGTAVLAGVDGSGEALTAVRWAAYEAALRGCELRILHVVPDAVHHGEPYGIRTVLLDAERAAVDARPGLQVRTDAVSGHPAERLIAGARSAGLLVVGRRGRGAVADLLLGSVSRAVAGRATVPTVAVDAPVIPESAVVVGTDGSAHAARAMDFAFDEARLRDARLIVVYALPSPIPRPQSELVPHYEPAVEPAAAREWLARWSAPWSRRHPGIEVTHQVRTGPAADVMCDVAGSGALLVVGSRGRGTVKSLLLGSVSLGVLHRHSGAVAVIGTGAGDVPHPGT